MSRDWLSANQLIRDFETVHNSHLVRVERRCSYKSVETYVGEVYREGEEGVAYQVLNLASSVNRIPGEQDIGQEPNGTNKQPIRTRYLGHVTRD